MDSFFLIPFCRGIILDESQKALILNPDLPLAHGLAGYVYFQQGKYNLAEKELLIALSLDPNENSLPDTFLALLFIDIILINLQKR